MDASSDTTKQRILEAAKTLLSSHGYESTTIDDIITAAGVTKGAFYHYFKSKEHLCEVIIEQAHSEYQQLAASIPPDAWPARTIASHARKSGPTQRLRRMGKLPPDAAAFTEPHSESPEISA